MELMLTSFGISHMGHPRDEASNIFYRMPPVSVYRKTDELMPDYATLLLCDRVIVDTKTFEILKEGDYYSSFEEVAKLYKALYDEGFIRLENFDDIVDTNRNLLERMLSRDLKRLDDWVQPFKESLKTWDEIFSMFSTLGRINWRFNDWDGHWIHSPSGMRYGEQVGLFEEALNSSRLRLKSKYRSEMRKVFADYLSYVNANLVLSQVLGVGFHDWYDFAPFYREKFLVVGQEQTLEQQKIEQVKRLFEVSFPEFTFWDVKSVMKALKDKRIFELRSLVDSAVRGEVEFDREFANRILVEVLKTEHKLGRSRNIVSYATLPIDLVPWVGTVAAKAVEELVSKIVERKARKELQWFYFISELARKAPIRDDMLKLTSKAIGLGGGISKPVPEWLKRLRNTSTQKEVIDRDKNISQEVKLTDVQEDKSDFSSSISVPLLEHMSASEFTSALEDCFILERHDYYGTLDSTDENVIALRVVGDSMNDALITDGDIIFLHPNTSVQNDDLVIVWLTDCNKITVKRLYYEEDRIRLQPENNTLDPIHVDPSVVQVLGKVVALTRRVNRRLDEDEYEAWFRRQNL